MIDWFFAYGTLRRGAPMHGLLADRARYVGAASAPGRLLDLGDFPALAGPARAGDRVAGELFAIADEDADALLDVLDRYEGRSFARERATVQGPEGLVSAWLYRWLGDPDGRAVVPGGDYLALGRLRPAPPDPGGGRP